MRHFDAGRALALIERERVTTIGGVPTIVQQLLAHPDFTKFDLSSVRSVSYGGAPVAENLPSRIKCGPAPRALPSNGYGLTETSALVAQISGQQYLEHPTSCGQPLPVCEIAIVPESFDDAEPTPESRCATERGRRTLGQGAQRGPRLLAQTPSHLPMLLTRLGAHRRHRASRRRRTCSSSSIVPRT